MTTTDHAAETPRRPPMDAERIAARARMVADRRWPPSGRSDGDRLPSEWHDMGMGSGFVLGAQWAHAEALAAVERLTAERDEAHASLDAVRALHFPVVGHNVITGRPDTYCNEDCQDYPCATLHAIDGTPDPDDTPSDDPDDYYDPDEPGATRPQRVDWRGGCERSDHC